MGKGLEGFLLGWIHLPSSIARELSLLTSPDGGGEKSNRPLQIPPLASAPVESSDPSSALTIHPPAAMTLRWWLRAPWDYLMMALGLLYWGVFGGLMTLIGGPLHLILPKQTGEKLGRFLLHQLFRKFVVYLRLSDLVKADLTALDALEGIPHSFIAAPNHTSLWDVVFIIARLPSAVCVMKKQILHNVVLGGGARLAGYIANDGMTRMIRYATLSLEEGGQLLLFPEGTRTRPDARWINPIKLKEYLLLGHEIVAARFGEAEYYADFIHIADSHEEFINHLDAVLAGRKAPGDRAALLAKASWDDRVVELISVMDGISAKSKGKEQACAAS